MNHELTHYQGVMQVKFKKPKIETTEKHEVTKRGKISHFSKASRRRLLNQILKLTNRPGYYFVTLTYPKDYSEDFTVWKEQLHRLYSTLRYHCPKMGFLWKLEFQKRGAPHFHLLMFVPSEPHPTELWHLIRDSWYRIVSTKSKSFRHHGVDVQKVRDIKTSGFYLAMYQAKDGYERTDIPIGRTWGIYGKKLMPMMAFGSEELNEHHYTILKRVIRKWVSKQKNSRNYAKYLTGRIGSFQIFIPVHEQIRLMDWIKRSSQPIGT